MSNIHNVMFPQIYSKEYSHNLENLKITLITHGSSDMGSFDKISRGKYAITHFHTCYELFFCEKGTLRIRINNEHLIVNENEIVIISPKILHSTLDSDENSVIFQMFFNVFSNGLKTNMDIYKIVSGLLSEDYKIIYGADVLKENIKTLIVSGEEGNLFKISRCFSEFIFKLVEHTGNVPLKSDVLNSDDSNIRLHRIYSYIHSKYYEEITLEQIAQILHLSTRQVCRIIKENFGCTFRELIVKVRMEKAGEKLLESHCKIADIIGEVGYNSLRGFYNAFKKHYGCLPSEYRKRVEKQKSNDC